MGFECCPCALRITALSYLVLQRRQLGRSGKLFGSKLRRRAQLPFKVRGPDRSEHACHCIDTPQDQFNHVGQTVSGVFAEYRIDRRGNPSQCLDVRCRALHSACDHSEHLTRPFDTHIEPRIVRQEIFFRGD